MHAQSAIPAVEYDSVELRAGRLHRIRRAQARVVGEQDGMADGRQVLLPLARRPHRRRGRDADPAHRLSSPSNTSSTWENLIGKELEGRILTDSGQRQRQFYLDLPGTRRVSD